MALKMNFDYEDLLDVYTNPQIPNVPAITEIEAKTYAEPLKKAMLKHGCTNRRRAAHYYQAIGDLMGVDIAGDPGLIGCKANNPVEWPRDIARCMEVGPAFFRWRGLWSLADQGDAGFEPIMLRVLGAVIHPSYNDRWALYRAMINKPPRPLFVDG